MQNQNNWYGSPQETFSYPTIYSLSTVDVVPIYLLATAVQMPTRIQWLCVYVNYKALHLYDFIQETTSVIIYIYSYWNSAITN